MGLHQFVDLVQVAASKQEGVISFLQSEGDPGTKVSKELKRQR
jgi:hypothetical protein